MKQLILNFFKVGIGGMVINEHKQVLVVQEKFHKKPHWKLPGGYVDPGINNVHFSRMNCQFTICLFIYLWFNPAGESLPEAVKREVFEETGIKTDFVSLVALRHLQPQKKMGFRGVFECSDFYFVAFLRAVGNQDIKMCQRELRDAQWMDVSPDLCSGVQGYPFFSI